MKDYGFQRNQFPASIEYDLDGEMKGLLGPKAGGFDSGLIASNPVAAKSVELFQRMLDEPSRSHGGFQMRVRQEADGVSVTGGLSERRIEVECPCCIELHTVPLLPGRCRLARRRLTQYPWSSAGKGFTAIVKHSSHRLEAFVVRE